jgi:hypothetical protein
MGRAAPFTDGLGQKLKQEKEQTMPIDFCWVGRGKGSNDPPFRHFFAEGPLDLTSSERGSMFIWT